MTPKDKLTEILEFLSDEGQEGAEHLAVTFEPVEGESAPATDAAAARREALDRALARTNAKFGETLRKLAQ